MFKLFTSLFTCILVSASCLSSLASATLPPIRPVANTLPPIDPYAPAHNLSLKTFAFMKAARTAKYGYPVAPKQVACACHKASALRYR